MNIKKCRRILRSYFSHNLKLACAKLSRLRLKQVGEMEIYITCDHAHPHTVYDKITVLALRHSSSCRAFFPACTLSGGANQSVHREQK